MNRHALKPYWVRMTYQSLGNRHVMQFSVGGVLPWNTGTLPNVLQRGSDSQDLASAMIDFVSVLVGSFHSDFNVVDWQAYRQLGDDDAPVWTYAGVPAVSTGTATTVNTPFMQTTFSFRTGAGGRFKIVLVEASDLTDIKHAYSNFGPGSASRALVDFILSDANFIQGRDGSYPIAFLSYETKTNNYLRRKGIHVG